MTDTVQRQGLTSRAKWLRRVSCWILAGLYVIAGIFHITLPGPFLRITPHWVVFPHQVIFGTGLCELAGALALLTTRFRGLAGICLALYAVCVYPANINHAFETVPPALVKMGQMHLGWWYHAPRLALQPVLVWWALFAGEVVTWPFTTRLESQTDDARRAGRVKISEHSS